MNRTGQRGEIRIGFILGLIVLVCAIYLAVKMVPVMYHSYAFQAAVEDIAMEAAGQRARARNFDKIVHRVLNEADVHDVKEDILRTARERNIEPVSVDRSSSELTIHVEYVKPVDLIVTTWNWKVDKTERRTLY
jgi:uncharacterized protein YabE (DUF348 family)